MERLARQQLLNLPRARSAEKGADESRDKFASAVHLSADTLLLQGITIIFHFQSDTPINILTS